MCHETCQRLPEKETIYKHAIIKEIMQLPRAGAKNTAIVPPA
jgi:hypothetical protein